MFQAAAYQKGLLVESSEVPLPWDFTVTNPEKPKEVFRVQVKGTNTLMTEEGRRVGRYQIVAKTGSKNLEGIDTNIIDVLSLYVEPTQTWYNIPTTALTGKSVWLYPHLRDHKGKYEMWKYDWSVFFA